jgi:hypothetical protein
MASRNLRGWVHRICVVAAVIGIAALPLTAAAGTASTTMGAVFLRKIPSAILNDQTNSMSVGADSAGGMHAVFANSYTDTNGNYNAYYDYCAPGQDCAMVANWARVTLLTVASADTIMDATQLAVDAQGRPRVVIVTSDSGGAFMYHYYYDACDSGCTSLANWHIAEVADGTSCCLTFIFDGNKHFFALDPQGRPRFIVDNGVNYEYHSCNLACIGAGSWITLTLNGTSSTDGSNTPALAFNSTGQPRMLAPLQDESFHTNLMYWECNTNDCGTNAGSWSTAAMVSPISGLAATYSSLRITHTGQPRFAYYGVPTGTAETLYYYWCHSACTTASNWTFSSVGLVPAENFETSGQEPDLALDGQDHPHLSFQSLDTTLGNGLGYAWCSLNCESGSGSWQSLLADSNSQLDSDWNRLPPAGCSSSAWIGANRSALVLDSAGNARMGYDAEHYSSGCADPGLNGQDYRSVRFVYFHSDTLPGPNRLYLPLAIK